MMKKKSLLALSLALLLLLTACGGGTTPASTAPSASPEPVSKTLNVHIEVEVASLDSQIATDGTSFEVIADMIDGLCMPDADGNPVLALADSIEESEDGLTYTIHIRDDANWSNGEPVTANDFVFGWRRAVDPAVASEYNFIMEIAGVLNAGDVISGAKPVEDLGITAVDEKTLEIKLDVPVSFFRSLLYFPTFYPINEEFFKSCSNGDTYGTSPETFLSCGAFKLASYEPAATSFSLVKNPDYYDAAKIQLDGIDYQVIKDSQQAMLAYSNGTLDIVTLSGEQVEQYQNDPEFTNIMAGYLWYLSPNQTVAGLENLNIRKAMACAFDKNAIVSNILKDGSIVADFNVPVDLATGPDGKDFRDGTATYNQYNVEKAKEYWAAGLSELGVSSLTYTMIVEDTESAQNVAQFIQSELQTNLEGLTINIETMPKKNRVERMQDGNFEIGLTRWGPDYADPMTYLDMWITGSPNNYGFWSNAEYDAIIQSAKKGELALDPTARWEALKQAEGIAADEVVIMPIYQKGNAVMIKTGVEGIEFHAIALNRVFKNVTKG